jgi:hypothetical protein
MATSTEGQGHTPGPWFWAEDSRGNRTNLMRSGSGDYVATPQADIGDYGLSVDRWTDASDADASLIAAAPELLEALKEAQDVIYGLRQDLHHRRIADWYPEGAHNAAESMSEDMRLLGNHLVGVDFSAAIAKAEGRS